MSEDAVAVRRALEDHDAFEAIDPLDAADAVDHPDAIDAGDSTDVATVEVTTTPFDATIAGAPADADGKNAAFTVEVAVPSLDAAVPDEDVADVVEDGWYESLSLHLADAPDVAEVDDLEEQSIDRRADRVVLTVRFRAWDADSGAADAKAIVDYVEGTYVQAVIPGYEYGEPVAGLLSRATDDPGEDDSGARRGGTPL